MSLDPTAVRAAVDQLVDAHNVQEAAWRAATDAAAAKAAKLEADLAAAQGRPATVVVDPGATMTAVAAKHGVTVDQVKAWNPDVVPTSMPVGSRLWLVDRATVPTSEPAPQPAPEPEPQPPPIPKPVFSLDFGDITGSPDEPVPESQKRADHVAMLGVDNVQHVRVFFGSAVPSWNTERLQALTEKDSVIISTLSTDGAGLAKFLANTPDKFRQRHGQVGLAHGHEKDAELLAATNPTAAIKAWLDGNRQKADLLVASDLDSDEFDLYKILLHYTQEHDTKLSNRRTRELFYGGQDFGTWGEDVYHFQTWLNQQDRYESAEELFGPCIAFAESKDLPVMFAEWGGTRAKTDTTGVRRAQAIAEGGAFLIAENERLVAKGGRCRIKGANWWCAAGRVLDGVRLMHHLEVGGPASPEIPAFAELAR